MPLTQMDKLEKKISSLIKKASKIGWVTLAQLNEALPDDASSPEQIEAAMAMIEDGGLEIVERPGTQAKNRKGRSGKGRCRSQLPQR